MKQNCLPRFSVLIRNSRFPWASWQVAQVILPFQSRGKPAGIAKDGLISDGWERPSDVWHPSHRRSISRTKIFFPPETER
jgi:hypothetical protein